MYFPFSSDDGSDERPPLRHYDLDALSDRELEALLFEGNLPRQESSWKLSSLERCLAVGAGAVLLFGLLGWSTGPVLRLALPLLVVALVLFVARNAHSKARSAWNAMQERGTSSTSRRLTRSTSDRKVAGVCGGLAAHLDIDSTVVRFAVLVALLATSVAPVGLAYLALAYLLPRGPDAATELASEERLRIIRES